MTALRSAVVETRGSCARTVCMHGRGGGLSERPTAGIPGQSLPISDFAAGRPDEKWDDDISYVWTREGWLYLAVVIDLFAAASSVGLSATACTAIWP